ncbi:hypothetical protein KEM52_002389 [Ascosphaera acerosa]|nr:hypothetical protein KEM52_002389 [Ascosphaera acerosa]
MSTAIDKARAKAEKERQKKLQETEAGLTALSQQLKRQKLKAKTAATPSAAAAAAAHGADASDSDFGDETHIEAHVLAEEAAKRRSLRFYTSQIDQKANKRHAAGREAGGDEDLPYRERLKDRQARLLAQAEKRGREAPDVLGGASDEEDDRVARELRSDAAALGGGGGRGGGGRGGGGRGRGGDTSDSDDYYDMVAARTHAKKAEKRQRAEAYADALKQSRHVEVQEEIGPDGKRAITYAIQKNKGLTPHRKKDVRNPRVKKRKDYAKKQKKLGSIRQVYKGGEGRGGYGGELTGIKTNVVKSVKL